MRQMNYVMQFKGKAAPANESGTVLKGNTTAPSCAITSVAGSDGISGTLQPTGSAEAKFQSEVTFTGATSFQESGTISFGFNFLVSGAGEVTDNHFGVIFLKE